MKNFFKFLGIISLVLVMGFSMAACKDDDGGDDNGGDDNGGQQQGGGGGLTIQNPPSGSISVGGFINQAAPTTQSSVPSVMAGDLTNSGQPPVVKLLSTTTYAEYTGSDSVLILIRLASPETYKFTVVQFANGVATVDWNTMTEVSSLPQN